MSEDELIAEYDKVITEMAKAKARLRQAEVIFWFAVVLLLLTIIHSISTLTH